MKKRKLISAICFVLAVVTVFSVTPFGQQTASAGSINDNMKNIDPVYCVGSTDESGNFYFRKSVKAVTGEDDVFDVEIEAFSKETTTTSETKAPLDLVLMCDGSNSMSSDDIANIRSAILHVCDAIKDLNNGSTVSMVSFAGADTDGIRNALGLNHQWKFEDKNPCNSDDMSTIKAAVKEWRTGFVFTGTTHLGTPTYTCLKNVRSWFKSRQQADKSAGRKQVLIMMTDGCPDNSDQPNWDTGLGTLTGLAYKLNDCLGVANSLKNDDGVIIGAIGYNTAMKNVATSHKDLITYAGDSSKYHLNTRQAVTWLNLMTSNYKKVNYNSYEWEGNDTAGQDWRNADTWISGGTRNDNINYYFSGSSEATVKEALTNLMTSIFSTTTTGIKWPSTAQIRDTIAQQFQLVGTPKLYMVPYQKNSSTGQPEWGTAVEMTSSNMTTMDYSTYAKNKTSAINKNSGKVILAYSNGGASKSSYDQIEITNWNYTANTDTIKYLVIHNEATSTYSGYKLRLTYRIRAMDQFWGGASTAINSLTASSSLGVFNTDTTGSLDKNYSGQSPTVNVPVQDIKLDNVSGTGYYGNTYTIDDVINSKTDKTLLYYNGRITPSNKYVFTITNPETIYNDSTGKAYAGWSDSIVMELDSNYTNQQLWIYHP